MDLGGGLGHLTYSTLVHPGDTWAEMWDSLTTYVPRVKARLAPGARFGVSLRLSAASAQTLVDSPEERIKLKRFLDDNDLYLYTVNAFPFGPFKNQVVKEEVYEPDWRSEARARYTKNVAEILAEVGGSDVNPSIQSPPLGFKPRVTGPDVVEAYAAGMREMAAFLHRLRERTGRTVTLAVEPEPACFLETTAETVDFFVNVLRSDGSIRALATELGVPDDEARTIFKRHVGTVYDICHQAVEFEDITASLQALVDNDIPVFKLQEAAAVRIPDVTQSSVEALREYADSVYLTQTIERRDGKLTRFLNLEDAFAAYQADPGGSPREWRIHFHVPVFLDSLGEHFKTTRFAIEEALAFHRRTPLSAQLEIETYTWDVLPKHLKTGDIVDYVVQELEWVRGQLLDEKAAAE
ncbi:MAG TPA: metabolite traffic protein EboE [Caulobacteraceae bacterium]|jgi:sugar phosphate isomerase/epimerase|nr:metabolite traffic protein EboE [Caulobacteraceae bacterium]